MFVLKVIYDDQMMPMQLSPKAEILLFTQVGVPFMALLYAPL